MSFANKFAPERPDYLLSLPSRERSTFLRDAGWLNQEGLDRLLDATDRLMKDDPGTARRLAELCTEIAEEAGAPAAVPRAKYLIAYTYVENGQPDAALRLIEAAHNGYVELGMILEALRTNVGRMAAHFELGRYLEALDTGQAVLDALGGEGSPGLSPTRGQKDLLIGLIQQNRGRCYEQMGHYDKALDAYSGAEKEYRNLGTRERLGEILDNRATILSYLGRSTEALADHKAAAAIFSEANLTLSHAMSLSNVGETYLRVADFVNALTAFERARRSLSSLDARAEEYFLLRNTADAYLALNLYSEALSSYQEVDSLLRDAGMEHDRAQALWGMGSALMARSELEKAEDALGEAARLFVAAGNVPMLSGVMLEQAAIQEVRSDHQTALATAHRALELVSEKGWPAQEVYARLRLADLLPPDAAETHLLAARRLADRLALPQLRYRLDERLGHLRRLQGRDQEALVLLGAAVDEIERLRGTVAQDAMRASFLQDKTVAYEDLLLLHLARDGDRDVRRAFAVAERAKSRALIDLLTGVGEKEPVDRESGARIRTLQADLNGIYSEFIGGAGDDERPTSLPNLKARAVELEREISRLRLQAAVAGSTSDPFAASGPADDNVPPDVAMVAYHILGEDIMAFVSVGGRIGVLRDLSTVPNVQRLLQKLDIQWQRFRASREFARRHTAMLERSTRRVLAALYDELVAPLELLLERAASDVPDDVPKLAVVPHGPLHQVPFHALFDGGRYLIERFEVSYAPSATVYSLCQERETREPEKAVVFGVDDPLIPAATAEAETVAGLFPGAELLLGEIATIENLRNTAPKSGTLHLACHGLFRSDNPMFSALELHDGWLIAADAMSLELSGSLVTLSACESGRSEVIGGDEVLGLTRAFLGAGAATLVVSLWLVQDGTTAELMGGLYERLGNGEGRAAALRAAQLELKEKHPHPYFWAPFVVIGKR